jgi:hypothetical protein
VDPYIEREWWLVAMDVLLLRKPAYRHVLLNYYTHERLFPNHYDSHSTAHDDGTTAVTAMTTTTTTTTTCSLMRGVAPCGLAACLLDAYLRYDAILPILQSMRTTTALMSSELPIPPILVMIYLFFGSIVSLTTLLVGTIAWARHDFDSVPRRTNPPRSQNNDRSTPVTTVAQEEGLPLLRTMMTMRLVWAILLPYAFHVVTIFVHIWEPFPSSHLVSMGHRSSNGSIMTGSHGSSPADTVRILSAFFVTSFQWTAVSVVMERHVDNHPNQNNRQTKNTVRIPWCLWVGILLRILVICILGILTRNLFISFTMMSSTSSPLFGTTYCSGWGIQIPWQPHHLHDPPLTICLS